MNTLIIYAHPNHQSLSYSFYKSILKGINTKADSVQTIDLYAENFNPALVYNEEKRRRDMHQRNERPSWLSASMAWQRPSDVNEKSTL